MEGLDCKKDNCIHYGHLGCHGGDDPMNQTACRLSLEEFDECINNDFSRFKEADTCYAYRSGSRPASRPKLGL